MASILYMTFSNAFLSSISSFFIQMPLKFVIGSLIYKKSIGLYIEPLVIHFPCLYIPHYHSLC